MSISLVKGQKVDITKDRPGLSQIAVALGWDPIGVHQRTQRSVVSAPAQPGLGARLSQLWDRASNAVQNATHQQGTMSPNGPSNMDIDASAICVNAAGKAIDLVYFGHQVSNDKSIHHSGDNLTGSGSGDDETILVTLPTVSSSTERIVFIVNIYDCVNRRQTFGMVTNAYIRVYNPFNNEEILRYNLTDDYANSTGIFVGEIYRRNGEWKFSAMGEGTSDTSITMMGRRYS